jgi:hypothetical protein
MRVYHGSYTGISTIDLSKCRPLRDFGQGFYVTKLREHAEAWAKRMGKKYNTAGVVTEFEFKNVALDYVCKVLRFADYSEEWLDFVVINRNSRELMHDYDIVEGPVADDKIQNRIQDYANGDISKEVFLNELAWHAETHQICFCTVNSLQMLERVDNTVELKIKRMSESIMGALMSDRGIDETAAADIFFMSDTLDSLENADTKLYLKSWSEIYEMLKAELDTL